MASAQFSEARQPNFKDPVFKTTLQCLRQSDNTTNLLYFCRTYLYFILVIGGAIWFDLHRAAAGWSFWWNAPVGLLTILLVGAGQHQLSGLGHEGAHHILFRNRWFNDLASDLLCMFPLVTQQHPPLPPPTSGPSPICQRPRARP